MGILHRGRGKGVVKGVIRKPGAYRGEGGGKGRAWETLGV